MIHSRIFPFRVCTIFGDMFTSLSIGFVKRNRVMNEKAKRNVGY